VIFIDENGDADGCANAGQEAANKAASRTAFPDSGRPQSLAYRRQRLGRPRLFFTDSFAFLYLSFSKADTCSATVILDKLNSGDLERTANSRLIRKRNWNFSIHDLGSADGSYPYL
jgi:hypothetical protein